MISISLFLITSILASIAFWILICIGVAILMFGDDRAFVVGPVIATVSVLLWWLTFAGVIRFVE